LKRIIGLAASLLLSSSHLPVLAQAPKLPAMFTTRPAISSYARPVAYPNANASAVGEHFNKARKLAGDDLFVFFDTLCVQDQLYKERINGVQYNGIIPAQKVFDNVYYLGQMMVSAWAIDTPAGIILIDALNNADEAREIMVPGLKAVGLDPARIKYVIITHSHGDHYGGAQYFRDTYGARLVASAADWEVMANPNAPFRNIRLFDAPPKKGPGDVTVKDGDTLSLGGEDIHFALTPGHTPGTISLTFKVTDKGVAHTAGMFDGVGMPRTDDLKKLQLRSIAHWMDVTRKAGVDVQMGNHPLHFDGPARLEILKYREPGQKHPFVIGNPAYQRFMGMLGECVRMSLARDGVTD
jgi:metallo-beta-lactamase class B